MESNSNNATVIRQNGIHKVSSAEKEEDNGFIINNHHWYDFIIGIILVLFSVFMIVEGLFCLNGCESESNIPIWLIVHGSCRLLLIILYIIMTLCNRYTAPKQEEFESFLMVIILFLISWFITGNVLVYNNSEPKNCDCFYIAFWSLVAIWIFYAIVISIFIVLKMNSKFLRKKDHVADVEIKSYKIKAFTSSQNQLNTKV